MSYQVSTDNVNFPLIKAGNSLTRTATVIQDAGRTTDIVHGTIMAQIAASEKWTPFDDETATDGSATARGVYVDMDITGAQISAGDVEDKAILVGSEVLLDPALVTIENSKTLDTVVGAGTVNARRVEDDLNAVGIFFEDNIAIDGLENS